jgi:hypothetical protein
MTWKVKAHFGPIRSVDVTQRLIGADGQLNNDPPHCDWASLGRKNPLYLRITHKTLLNWRPLRVATDCKFELSAPGNVDFTKLKTRIVYFVNCYVNDNYMYMVSSQLNELRETGLLSQTQCELHVVSSGTLAHRDSLAAELKKRFGTAFSVYHEHTEANQFEYPGIKKVWELGQRAENSYVLYFHARGLSRLKLGRLRRNRQRQEKRLFRRVLGDWMHNLTWLEHITTADKLGLTCGGNGWIWYNFWWARGSYIGRLEKPVITDRRHYYEDWLGRVISAEGLSADYPNTLGRCLSLAHSDTFRKYNLGSDFHPLRGETHLGLPWGYLKAAVGKIRSWVTALNRH